VLDETQILNSADLIQNRDPIASVHLTPTHMIKSL